VSDEQIAQLHRFADEAGIDHQELLDAWLVASAWPPETRQPDVPWEVHFLLAERADRFEVMDAFVEDCRAQGVEPTVAALHAFLARISRE